MARFELKMNGKTKSFNSGYAMWKWANQESKGKLETKFDDKKGPFLSDFFQRLWEHRQKKANQES
jgi:hypothetical protein